MVVAGDSGSNGYVCPVIAWFIEWMTTTWEFLEPSLVVSTPWSICHQRNAKTFTNCRKVEYAVFNEIKVTCLIWSFAGGVFLKPLFVVNYLLCNSSPVFS